MMIPEDVFLMLSRMWNAVVYFFAPLLFIFLLSWALHGMTRGYDGHA